MKNETNIPLNDFELLFMETANRKGFRSAAIIEKDFWVVWLLDQIFSEPDFYDALIFKGGTSLSKGFNLIHRFSEDIDLTIDRTQLNINESIDEIGALGNKRRKRFLDHLSLTTTQYIASFTEKLKSQLEKIDLLNNTQWKLTHNIETGQVYFEYPLLLENTLYPDAAYIKPQILLEFGSRGANTPFIKKTLTPYISESFENIILTKQTPIKILSPSRTFWEKATLLHMLANESPDKPFRPVLARHYYDLMLLAKHSVGDEALNDIELLNNVVKQKSILFKSASAKYDEILETGIKLIPNKNRLQDVAADYGRMEEMFFNVPPKFSIITETLTELEERINEKILKRD